MGPEMKVPAEADESNSCAMGVDDGRLELAESGQQAQIGANLSGRPKRAVSRPGRA